MTELSSVLHTLIDRPLAAPPPVEVVLGRSRRLRARRRWMRAGSATAVLGFLVAGTIAWNGSSPTTVSLTGGNQTAGYVAVAPGGYEGAGTWRLTIVRAGRTLEYTSDVSPRCAPIGTIQTGDQVRGEIRGDESLLRAGEAAHC
jgi:hypothetical protein